MGKFEGEVSDVTKGSIMRVASLFLVTLLGHGCAAKKIIVKNADLIIENQIEKRLPLHFSQKKQLSKDVDKFLNEQKSFAKEAIPEISGIELDQNKTEAAYDRLTSLYRKLALNFSKLVAKHMATLDKKQQKEFSERLEKENQSLAKTNAKERTEKIEDRFESMFGKISDEQQKILKKQKAYFEERNKTRISRRSALHEKFKAIYETNESPEARTNSLYQTFEEYQNNYPESPMNKEIIQSIVPTLDKKQKEVFANKTRDLVDILNYYLETKY